MSRKSNLKEVIRELFAFSGNRCAYPGCSNRLINEDGTYIAEICHIEAANPKGERYNLNQTDEERREAANLILLCHEHHKVTDDVDKYTVPILKKMKLEHESKFRNAPYTIDENVLEKLVDELHKKLYQLIELSVDTNTIVHSVDQKMDLLMHRVAALSPHDNEKLFIAELDAIKDLSKKGKVHTVIEMLLSYKERNWSKLNPETKYKVIANLANSYLTLGKKNEYFEITKELDNIPFQSPESVSLRLLGYAVGGDAEGFDAYFKRAVSVARDNINLWVAYIERYKDVKTSQEFLQEIPLSVSDTGNIIFHIGQLVIKEGRKNEGIELIKKAISKLDPAKERLSDSNAIVATYLMQDLVDPNKSLFNSYTESEKSDLEQAHRLLSESWDHIKNTELASTKWYIVLNRGVVNKILGKLNEAVADFLKAYELSNEYLPYKNLLMAYLQLEDLTSAEKLLLNPSYKTELPEEEKEINETFKAKILIMQGRTDDAITHLAALLKRIPGAKGDRDLYGIIISTFLQNRAFDKAKPYVDELITAFPDDPNGHLFSGFINLSTDKPKAMEAFDKAASLLRDSSHVSLYSELASGYSSLGEFEKAIPAFEKIVDLSIYNDFSRGLIYAVYQSGDSEKALSLANALFDKYPSEPFLAEIIGNIYDETKRYDEAIKVTESFQKKSEREVRDYFSFRAARMYSRKNDWSSVRRMANEVKDFSRIPMNDIFLLAYLLVKSGEKDKGMKIGFEARTKYFDNSEAHVKYISLNISSGDRHEDLFPEVVKVDCAVTVNTEKANQETYLITDNISRGENVLKPSDGFAQKLLGKKIGDELVLNKGYGIDYKVTVAGIMTIFVHAFRESLRLFETRFAGMHGIGVFQASPGNPDDQIEKVVKDSTLSGNEFQRQVYDIYNMRIATIGVLAALFKRNVVKQWMALVSSRDINIYSYSHDEGMQLRTTITDATPVVLDITSLLTNFFMLPEAILFGYSNKEIYVTQSTIEELQEFHNELEVHVEDGMLSMGYQDGRMVGRSMSSDEVIKQRKKISDIIDWCKSNAKIKVPADLIKIKRKDRQRSAELLGDCFFDTALLARELKATVISDDDTYKNVLRREYGVESFSTFQLALWEAQQDRLTNDLFEKLILQCVLGNYIYMPINSDIMWKVFDLAGFQIRKPFTNAIKGLHILAPGLTTAIVSAFIKKLYLESGLVSTREQTILAILGELSKRQDFKEIKKVLIVFLKKDLKLLQPALISILKLINTI